MNYSLESWILGLLIVSLLLGGVTTWGFLKLLRWYLGITKDESTEKHVPPWLTGVIERLFFTCVIAFKLSGVAIAMIGWITLKMVTNWNRPSTDKDQKTTGAFSALLAGLVSMLFAIIGGLIVNGNLHIV